MTRTFLETLLFTKKWYELGFNDDDLLELQVFLMKNPEAGEMMTGTGGIRKLRYAFPGQGKSGSSRVCYIDFALDETIHLITVFSKKEQENLTKEQKNKLKKLVKRLKGDLEG